MNLTITEVSHEEFKEIITEGLPVEAVEREVTYHYRIANLECGDDHSTAYLSGHIQACRAAAEIANEADARIAELKARIVELEVALTETIQDGTEGAENFLKRAVAAEADAERLRGALERLEWSKRLAFTGDVMQCPVCLHLQRDGQHSPECFIGAALSPAAEQAEVKLAQDDIGLKAENQRLRAALRELDWHNPLDCDLHLYLHGLACWGLGKVEKRPDAKADYDLDLLIPNNIHERGKGGLMAGLLWGIGCAAAAALIFKALSVLDGGEE